MKKKIIIGVITLIVVSLLGIYLYYQNDFLEVNYYNISSEKIPSQFNNFKIAHVSDFHNIISKRLTNTLISELKSGRPDIIVITGDLIDSNRTKIDVSLSFVEKIISIAPIYFVTGNHECLIDNYNVLEHGLEDLGVNILYNEKVILEKEGRFIEMFGLDDPKFENYYDDYELNSKVVNNNLEELIQDNDNYKILLSHRPEHFDSYVLNNIDLVFSGHAHGGQFILPFIGSLYAPNQGLLPKYVLGLYQEDNTNMIVSRGIGNSVFPFRVNNRPELIFVNLKSI